MIPGKVVSDMELKPCPACGADAWLQHSDNTLLCGWQAACRGATECGLSNGPFYGKYDDEKEKGHARDAWNALPRAESPNARLLEFAKLVCEKEEGAAKEMHRKDLGFPPKVGWESYLSGIGRRAQRAIKSAESPEQPNDEYLINNEAAAELARAVIDEWDEVMPLPSGMPPVIKRKVYDLAHATIMSIPRKDG